MRSVEFPPARQRYRQLAHCPRCGAAFRAADFLDADCLYLCSSCGFDFYQNPVPAAVVVIPAPRDPHAVLVLKRATSPGAGRWCVPGGFIRYGEQPVDAARREAREETGAEVEVGALLRAGLLDYSYRGAHLCIVEIAYLAHLCEPHLPLAASTSEATELGFRPLEELLATPSELAFPEQEDVLRAYQRHLAATPISD